jgi:hypothetical protein
MTIEQFIEDAITDYDEFENGQPVSIQVDPLAFGNGIKFDLTPGNADLAIPSGEIFAIPFSNVSLTLPTLGKITVSAGTNAVIIQKAS